MKISDLKRRVNSSALRNTLVDCHPSIKRGRVWCRTCKKTIAVDAGECMAKGWPTCCGATMTIDHPSTWK